MHSASSRRESQNAFRRRKKGTVATRPHSSALGRTSGPVVPSNLAGAMSLDYRAVTRAMPLAAPAVTRLSDDLRLRRSIRTRQTLVGAVVWSTARRRFRFVIRLTRPTSAGVSPTTFRPPSRHIRRQRHDLRSVSIRCRPMSDVGGKAEIICSFRVFRILTRTRRSRGARD